MICWLMTWGHWWKHYPGKKAYVKCRICGKLPSRMWETLRRVTGLTKNYHVVWFGMNGCAALPYNAPDTKPKFERKVKYPIHFVTDFSFDGRWLQVACETDDFDSVTPHSPDATADIDMVNCSACRKVILAESLERRW